MKMQKMNSFKFHHVIILTLILFVTILMIIGCGGPKKVTDIKFIGQLLYDDADARDVTVANGIAYVADYKQGLITIEKAEVIKYKADKTRKIKDKKPRDRLEERFGPGRKPDHFS